MSTQSTRKKAAASEDKYRLDRYGNRHEITEQDVDPGPQPALPAAQAD